MIVGSIFVGGVVGGVQTPLLRQYADIPMGTTYVAAGGAAKNAQKPFLMGQLKNYGSPSCVTGIATGAIGLGLGLAGALKDKPIRNDAVNSGLLAYGSASFFGGLLSGAFPTGAWAAGVAADPANPIVPGKNVVIKPGGNQFSSNNSGAARAY